MQLLDTLRESDVFPNRQDVDPSSFSHREAARAVVYDSHGRVVLLHVATFNYHKLPGGGIEEGEDIKRALTRELLEEIGCEVTITGKVGDVVEYRDQQKMKQTSYCFTAQQIGTPQKPTFTEKELADGMSVVWMPDIDAAISVLSSDKPTNYAGHFITKRDLNLLKTARSLAVAG